MAVIFYIFSFLIKIKFIGKQIYIKGLFWYCLYILCSVFYRMYRKKYTILTKYDVTQNI